MHDRAHAEIEPADTPPHERPDWPMPSFDARDWAAAFVKINPTFDEGTALAWFASALMRGLDEGYARSREEKIRCIHDVEAEQAARIAALEAGLQPFAEFHKTLLLYRRNDGAWHGISTVKAAWPDHKRVLYGEFPDRNELVTNYRELYPRHFREAARLFGLSAETR